MTSPTETAAASKIATVLRVTSGNFLEMFDFFLFGIYASHIATAFFPTGSELSSLLLDLRDFWRRVPDASFGGHLPRRLCGPCRPPAGSRRHLVDHGHGHDPDRVRAGLRHHRACRAGSGADRPAAAGFLRRCRARRRLGLSLRDGTPRTERLLRLLAVGQPASRHRGGGAARLRTQQIVDAGPGRATGGGACRSSSAA